MFLEPTKKMIEQIRGISDQDIELVANTQQIIKTIELIMDWGGLSGKSVH